MWSSSPTRRQSLRPGSTPTPSPTPTCVQEAGSSLTTRLSWSTSVGSGTGTGAGAGAGTGAGLGAGAGAGLGAGAGAGVERRTPCSMTQAVFLPTGGPTSKHHNGERGPQLEPDLHGNRDEHHNIPHTQDCQKQEDQPEVRARAVANGIPASQLGTSSQGGKAETSTRTSTATGGVGPITTWCEVPKKKYTVVPTRMVNSPTLGGSPATRA